MLHICSTPFCCTLCLRRLEVHGILKIVIFEVQFVHFLKYGGEPMKEILKRMLCLTVLACMVLTLMPAYTPVAAAGETESVREAVTRQYDAFAATLNKTDIDEAAIRQLLNHAISGNGKHLVMGENDSVTGSMVNSNTFRAFMIDALTLGADMMQDEVLTQCLIGTDSLGWHDFACQYKVTRFEYNDTKSTADDVSAGALLSMVQFSGTVNANDKAMMLVVGGAKCRIWMKRTQFTADEITYNIQFYVEDNFNFDSDYSDADDKGYDTSLSKLINKVGKLMDYGLLDTYDWELSADFDLTVPNTCDHEAGNYRWEFNGTDLYSVTTDGNTENALTRIQTEKSDGTLYNPYYQTEQTVYLWHDVPWVVEFRMKGSKIFTLAPASTWNSDAPFLVKTWGHCMGGTYFKYQETDPETGEEVTKGGRDQYGIQFSNYGYKHNVMHTYRLENRINADGTNMVYLLIDGEELGPMTTHYINKGGTNYDQGEQGDWFCGTDFFINYIFNASCRFDSSLEIEYIQIWERGENATDFSYFEKTVTEPTCTQQGYTTCVCRLCGASYTTDKVAALGHRYTQTVTEPTCAGRGYTTYTCTVCGDSYEDHYVDALGHTWTDATCTEAQICTTCGAAGAGPLGHTWADATCTDPQTCTTCGVTEGEAKGHTWADATCTTPKTCATCGMIEGETLGHHYEAVVTAPTCTAEGYTTYTCTACGDSYVGDRVEAKGHVAVRDDAVGATCTGSGLTEGSHCLICGEVIVAQEVIPATGHSYKSVYTEPTCTEQGCTTHTCTECGDSYVDGYVDALGHTDGQSVRENYAAPTAGAEGGYDEVVYCAECGAELSRTHVVLAKLGDISGDGYVDSDDAALILKYDVGLTDETGLDLFAGDVNGDGYVDSDDAALILKYDVGLIEGF